MYQILLSSVFDRDSDTKEIVKSHFNKSYDAFYDELEIFLKNLNFDTIISLGKNLYKCDFSPTQYGKGARKAYRLIIGIIKIKNVIIPIKIYKKSNISNINKEILVMILEQISNELNI
jgi:hypothetical protein